MGVAMLTPIDQPLGSLVPGRLSHRLPPFGIEFVVYP
jgi:hypothetical protein